VISRSTDDGVTWSAAESITPQLKDPAWRLCFQGPGNGIQLANGALVFPAQFKDAANVPHSCFIASTDGGRTWKISTPAIPSQPPTSESAIAEISDGSLLLSMRDESKSGQRLWSRWDFKGPDPLAGTWSSPRLQLPDPTCMASLIRHPSGALVFANAAHPKQRVALTVRVSRDGGTTWNDGRVIESGGAMYSSLTVLANGDLGVLYESVPEKGLVFARFPFAWVADAPAAVK
jgi:sialidase-1